MSEELKACGHCGGKSNRDLKYKVGTLYRVICSECKIRTGWYPTQGLADKAWNTRTPDINTEMLEALKDRSSYYYERDVTHQSQINVCRCRKCVDARVKQAIKAAQEVEG